MAEGEKCAVCRRPLEKSYYKCDYCEQAKEIEELKNSVRYIEALEKVAETANNLCGPKRFGIGMMQKTTYEELSKALEDLEKAKK